MFMGLFDVFALVHVKKTEEKTASLQRRRASLGPIVCWVLSSDKQIPFANPVLTLAYLGLKKLPQHEMYG